MKKILYILIKIRFIVIFLILCIFCWLFSCYGNDLMALFGLKWRPWVMKVALASCFLFKYAFIGSLAAIFIKFAYRKYLEKPSLLKQIAATVFAVLCVVLMFPVLWMELWALSSEPKEYIVIRDGKKCVASVIGWNDSSVSCHEYKGLFLMGKDTVSYEIYHRTNDPFESGVAPYDK